MRPLMFLKLNSYNKTTVIIIWKVSFHFTKSKQNSCMYVTTTIWIEFLSDFSYRMQTLKIKTTQLGINLGIFKQKKNTKNCGVK